MEKNLENTQTVESEKQERVFTQAEVNGLVARESKSAVERLLKSVGIAPEGDYKASLEAFRQWRDSKNAKIEKITAQMQKLQQQNAVLSQQLEALKIGILMEKLDRYTRLAKAYRAEDSTFIDALERMIKGLVSKWDALYGERKNAD